MKIQIPCVQLRGAEAVRSQPSADMWTTELCQHQHFKAEEDCADLEFCHGLANTAEIFSVFQVNMPKAFCCESGDLCLAAAPDL